MVGEVKKVKRERRAFHVEKIACAKRLRQDSVLSLVNLQVEVRANLF